MTQGELAARVGCNISTICTLERGRTQPSWELAVKLGDVFGVDPRELFPLPNRTEPSVVAEQGVPA
jgi:DNA-binding XRE family transcriptional regulator